MAVIRPDDLPAAGAFDDTVAIIIDDGSTVQKATPSQIVDAAGAGTIGIATVVGATRTLTLADKNMRLNFTNAAGCVLTIPPDSSVSFPPGSFIEIAQKGDGPVTVAWASPVNVASFDELVETAGLNAVAALRIIAVDEWDLFGKLI